MSDDGRLELDDSGGVVDSSGAQVELVDLVDLGAPESPEAPPPSALRTWARGTAAPWLRAHRRPVSVVTVIAVGGLALLGWSSSRPEPPPPAPAVTMLNAPVVGADLGGPRIGVDGHLSVAYAVTADPSLARVEVLGLVGPGLIPHGIEAGATTITASVGAFVQLSAQVSCDDPAIVAATSSSYGIVVRRTDSAGADVTSAVPFGTTTTALETAVREHCLAVIAPLLRVSAPTFATDAGSPAVALTFVVHNASALPVTVSGARGPSTGAEVDESPTVVVPAGGEMAVATRVLVHDCASAARLPALGSLPNPVTTGVLSRPASAEGLALRISVGSATGLASYPVAQRTGSPTLTSAACSGAPTLSTHLRDVRGAARPGAGWTVSGTLDVTTSGIGVALGRERFTGPPAGQGSQITTTDSRLAPGDWSLVPAQLDGGDGRLPVVFHGTTCADARTSMTRTVSVAVTTAARSVFRFEVPLDTTALRAALADACPRAG
jgi:hypothetical protein